jgi:diacylglycerol kinase (CTP)
MSGTIIPVLYLFLDRKMAVPILAGVCAVFGLFEFLRIKAIMRVPLVEKHTKEHERAKPLGSFYYVLSAMIVIGLFEKHVAVASLFTLSVADPLSSLVGKGIGRLHLLGKTLEGTATFFLCSLLIFLLFSFNVPTSLIAAAVAALTELLSGRHIDDNLSIPIMTALALTVLPRVT